MQRLVEQPNDEGEVWDGPVCLGRVHYHLSVYQHFSEAEHESVPPNLEVEGHIASLEGFDLANHPHGVELTLHLADGRLLDFATTDRGGRIRSTGRGLYRE